MPVLDLLLVRHGETDWNVEGRYQGHTDVPLSRIGVAQAMALARVLDPVHSRSPLVFSSDLIRARQTAALACPWAAAQHDARLRELAFGAFEGFTYDENTRRFGDRFTAWVTDPVDVTPVGGESMQQLQERIDGWMAALPDNGCAIAFTHGGVVRALLSRARGVQFDAHIRVPPAGAVWLRLQGGRMLPNEAQWLT